VTTPREQDYKTSYLLASKDLQSRDPEEVSLKSGALFQRDLDNSQTIRLPFLGRECIVTVPTVEVSYAQSEEEVPIWAKIVILHYLNTASGVPLSEKPVTFKEIPSGAFYLSAFDRRTKNSLVEVFGPQPERLLEASSQYGGKASDLGDHSVTILALPRVPITLVLWRGDDEFSPDGNVLFDETISRYLPTEDIAVLSQMLIIGMIRAMKAP
jgi:hypothetical protein